MQTIQIVWLVALIVFLLLEAVTATIVSIWFAAGALVALLVSLAWPGAVAVQVAAFLVVSAVALFALRPFAKRMMANRRVPTNADANIGKPAQVVSEIQPGRVGRVKLGGLEWAARADVVLPVGTWCRVQAIEGVTLVVVPQTLPSAEGVAQGTEDSGKTTGTGSV